MPFPPGARTRQVPHFFRKYKQVYHGHLDMKIR